MIAPTTNSIIVPASYSIRLCPRPPQTVVVIAPPNVTPTPEGVFDKPTISAALTFDPGLNWPDATGTATARRLLAHGGCVLLTFETLTDALTCHRRLLRERVQ